MLWFCATRSIHIARSGKWYSREPNRGLGLDLTYELLQVTCPEITEVGILQVDIGHELPRSSLIYRDILDHLDSELLNEEIL